MEPSLHLVAEVIGASGAGIVALQEVDVACPRTAWVHQPSELGRMVGMNSHFCCLVDWEQFPLSSEPQGEYGLAFLCHPGLHPRRIDCHDLPRLSGNREPRGIFQIEIQWNGLPVVIMNTHLSVQRRERAYQLWAVRQRVMELQAEGASLILMGDFNTVGVSQALRALRNSVPECTQTQPTFPSRFPFLRLDRVFASSTLACSSIRVVKSPLARQASDHLPVYVELSR
jgi:endonuclease/exonuclease/phosphatase family metal-dependent hydrolase